MRVGLVAVLLAAFAVWATQRQDLNLFVMGCVYAMLLHSGTEPRLWARSAN